jgi:hypothetical protein
MMVKEAQFFRKQAERAERMALTTSDADASQSFSSLAQAYRSQADALKESKKDKPGKKTEKDKAVNQKAARNLTVKKSKKKSRRR